MYKNNIKSSKSIAILDSSFYIHLVKINLLSLFLEYYNIVVCSKVKEEITFFKHKEIYLPRDIEIFYELEKKGIICIKDPLYIPKSLKSEVSDNTGEIYSISLAKEQQNIVFIDNGRPYKYCLKNKILCSNIVEFLLFLYKNKILSKKEILFKIKFIKKSLPKEYLKKINSKLK